MGNHLDTPPNNIPADLFEKIRDHIEEYGAEKAAYLAGKVAGIKIPAFAVDLLKDIITGDDIEDIAIRAACFAAAWILIHVVVS
ncbi:hypothetical protein QR680_003899 [Steinernema hermaphroditum]|uniref:Uncharacterized protein n=1 Tax=Steinernema hermaphroditum TaxID=289476 RepID=A0AA39LSW3_9BILA|nr:hypothetical protein QR680_003899 [Steinernema hermaphroditum]